VSDEPEVIAKLRYLHAATVDWLTTECATTGVTISPILAAYDAIVAERDAAIAECHEQARLNGMGSEREARIMAERDAAVRELEETRKREALSDAIVDECDSDITKLVQERASLRAERDAAVRERDAARDKNVQLHALVKKYKNKATKQSQKQKKNYKLAKYADESNATLRARLAAATELEAEVSAANRRLKARLAACEKVVEAAKAYEKWMGKWHDYTVSCGDKPAKQQRALIDAVRAAVAAETQGEK
jgi:chromosome segregation ATPase